MVDVLTRTLAETDPAIHAAVQQELLRQQGTLEMIASENFAPSAVMEAQGSVLTNKYAEGYPASVITAAANTLTWSSSWPSTVLSHCSAPNSPTCSPTPALRPTQRRCSP